MNGHFTAPGIEDEERAWRRGDYDLYGFYDDTPEHDEEDPPESYEDPPEGYTDGELAGSHDDCPF